MIKVFIIWFDIKMHTMHHWVTVSYDRLMVPPTNAYHNHTQWINQNVVESDIKYQKSQLFFIVNFFCYKLTDFGHIFPVLWLILQFSHLRGGTFSFCSRFLRLVIRICLVSHFSHFSTKPFPCSSDIFSAGIPESLWRPSVFWLIRYLSIPISINLQMASWVYVGRR